MKITKDKLQEIINEEVGRAIEKGYTPNIMPNSNIIVLFYSIVIILIILLAIFANFFN